MFVEINDRLMDRINPILKEYNITLYEFTDFAMENHINRCLSELEKPIKKTGEPHQYQVLRQDFLNVMKALKDREVPAKEIKPHTKHIFTIETYIDEDTFDYIYKHAKNHKRFLRAKAIPEFEDFD